MCDVIAHPVKYGRGVGRGFDAGDVQLRERLGVQQDRLKLGLESCDLLVGQFKAGEIRNVADIDVTVRHGRKVGNQEAISKCQVAGETRLKIFLKFFEH